jgi:AcrR family transcriptional regulator
MTHIFAGVVREPRQARSRRSWDRVVEAVIALMAKRGGATFTVAEVASASGVSIGSIYARVNSKEDLLRVAHGRLMDRLSRESTSGAEGTPDPAPDLPGTVQVAVAHMANLLRRHASELSPFMVLSRSDAVIRERGREAHRTMTTAYHERVMRAKKEIVRRDADSAVAWSGSMVYAVLARELGLGSDPAVAHEHDWGELIDNLVETVTAYLGSADKSTVRDPSHQHG